jgi:gliding motility-associated-like protein
VSLPGTYAVVVNNMGCIGVDSISVQFIDCSVMVPNAFSPNGDGLNDLFKAVYNMTPVEFELRIYNRWGQLLFATNDPLDGWDGVYKNKPCELGSYAWVCTYRTEGPSQLLKGNLTLLR